MRGILTYHFAHNYGAMLQAYALKKYLNKFEETVLINYCPENIAKQYSLDIIDKKYYKIPKRLIEFYKRKNQFDLFEKFKLQELTINNQVKKENLHDYCKEFSSVIVGSDQVWNTSINFNDNSYFLDFVGENTKRIGYSVSIGSSVLTDNLSRKLGMFIEKFDNVSFREASAAETISKLCIEKLDVTVDPVFLIERNEWIKLENRPDGIRDNEKFLLYYSLEDDKELENKAIALAKRKKIKIISIHPLCKKTKFADMNLNCVGPSEFLWLLNNSEYVASNSFHATAFSVIYDKKAIIVPHKTLGARNKDLLSLLDACLDENTNVINFLNVNKQKLFSKINFSKKYLDFNFKFTDRPKLVDKKFPVVYAARSLDKEILKKSSSGGMFTIISYEIIRQGGVVFASCYDYETHSARHKLLQDKMELEQARGSMYIQGSISEIYEQLANELKVGIKVMLFGMPCQIAAINRYCSKKNIDTSNLICCDIMCHGVPSPKIWREYIETIERKYKDTIKYVSFRNKKNGWKIPNPIVKVKKKEISIKPYSNLFYSDAFLRPSCYKCKYSSMYKESDLTIGDFWGIDETIPEFFSQDGNSIVLINSEKGEDIFDDIKNDIEYVKTNYLIGTQNNMLRPTQIPSYRNELWEEYNNHGIDYVLKKYFPTKIQDRIIRKLRKKF